MGWKIFINNEISPTSNAVINKIITKKPNKDISSYITPNKVDSVKHVIHKISDKKKNDTSELTLLVP